MLVIYKSKLLQMLKAQKYFLKKLLVVMRKMSHK